MSLFFRLLPTDVLKDILFVWLDHCDSNSGLIKALSNLDAICPIADRLTLRSTICQLPSFGEQRPLSVRSEYQERYLLWLHSRKVPVKALLLTGNAYPGLEGNGWTEFTLPTVERIHWKTQYPVSEFLVEAVLRCCPNVTSIVSKRTVAISSLAAKLAPKLKSVVVSFSYGSNSMYVSAGGLLTELRVVDCWLDDNTAQAIGKACPMLTTLEAANIYNVNAIILLLQSCVRMQELILGGEMTKAKLAQILAYRQIIRFTCKGYDHLFAWALLVRPDLQYLDISGNRYSSAERSLHLNDTSRSGVFSQILDVCTPVNRLRLAGAPLSDGIATLIAAKMGASLKHLMVTVGHSPPLGIVLQGCKFLTSLSFSGDCTDDILQAIAANGCPLTSISCLAFSASSAITDEGLAQFIPSCPNLEELAFHGYTGSHRSEDKPRHMLKSLQSILDCKLRMTMIGLRPTGDSAESDAKWFRQQAKENQLLPVPQVHVRCSEMY